MSRIPDRTRPQQPQSHCRAAAPSAATLLALAALAMAFASAERMGPRLACASTPREVLRLEPDVVKTIGARLADAARRIMVNSLAAVPAQPRLRIVDGTIQRRVPTAVIDPPRSAARVAVHLLNLPPPSDAA